MTYTLTPYLAKAARFANEEAARIAVTEFRDAEMERDPYAVYAVRYDCSFLDLSFTANLEPAPGMRGGTGYLTTEETP